MKQLAVHFYIFLSHIAPCAWMCASAFYRLMQRCIKCACFVALITNTGVLSFKYIRMTMSVVRLIWVPLFPPFVWPWVMVRLCTQKHCAYNAESITSVCVWHDELCQQSHFLFLCFSREQFTGDDIRARKLPSPPPSNLLSFLEEPLASTSLGSSDYTVVKQQMCSEIKEQYWHPFSFTRQRRRFLQSPPTPEKTSRLAS